MSWSAVSRPRGSRAGRTLTIERGPAISDAQRLIAAVAGGVLMGFGAKFARGCTSGQALTGGALLSAGSWIFIATCFATGYAAGAAGAEAVAMMPFTETGRSGATGGAAGGAGRSASRSAGVSSARGLGSAPKLAGQFYLTDLTVFKVMFSALVTAMLGAFWLDRFGVLDLGLVYLPETFVLPQAIGGVLFGAGFLVAGLCPGTSCVAAATGRLDGLAVIGGMLLGVLLFNVGYSQIEGLYTATAWGTVTHRRAGGHVSRRHGRRRDGCRPGRHLRSPGGRS